MKQDNLTPEMYEYEPKEVEDDAVFEVLSGSGVLPEELPDPERRAAYVKFLKTYKPGNSE